MRVLGSTSRTPTRRPRWRRWRCPPPSRSTLPSQRRPRGRARLGRHARGRALRAAARGRARLRANDGRPGRADDARGRQAARRERRRGRLDGGRLRLLRRDGPQLRRPRDPRRSSPRSSRWCSRSRWASWRRSCRGTTRCCCSRGSSRRRWRPATRCVCKPSELTPLSTLALAPCLDHLPPGVVNLLAGAGDVGEALVGDERVDGVAFTGSVETGKRIAVRCAERVARVNLEMGGKDPFIVCADVADGIDVAAKGGAWAAFLNAGQVCTSAERFYVMSEVYDDFVREFVDYTGSLVLGDPLEPGTDLGPMVSARQREKVAAQVDAAVAAGAEVADRRRRRRPAHRALLRAGGRHRRAGADRPAARGDLRPGGADRAGRVARRGDRSWPTRRASGSAPTSTRATSRPSCAACARSRRGRCGSTTR